MRLINIRLIARQYEHLQRLQRFAEVNSLFDAPIFHRTLVFNRIFVSEIISYLFYIDGFHTYLDLIPEIHN